MDTLIQVLKLLLLPAVVFCGPLAIYAAIEEALEKKAGE